MLVQSSVPLAEISLRDGQGYPVASKRDFQPKSLRDFEPIEDVDPCKHWLLKSHPIQIRLKAVKESAVCVIPVDSLAIQDSRPQWPARKCFAILLPNVVHPGGVSQPRLPVYKCKLKIYWADATYAIQTTEYQSDICVGNELSSLVSELQVSLMVLESLF